MFVPCLRRSPRVPLRLVVAVAVWLAPVASLRAERSAADCLTPQSVAAITVRPANVAVSPLVKDLPIEVAQAACQKYLGVPLESIERLTVVIEPPMGMSPYYAVVAHLTQKGSLDALHADITAHAKRSELDGKLLLESQQPMLPSLFMPNQRTLVVAPTAMIKKLAKQAAPPTEGPLVAAMNAGYGPSNDLHAAVVLEPLRPLIQMGLMQAQSQAPPEAQKFFAAIDHISGVIATADLSGMHDSALTVYAKSPEDADKLDALLDDALAMIRRQMFENAESPYQQLKASDDPVQQAMAAYMERSHETQVKTYRPTRSGTKSFDLARLKAGDPVSQLQSVAVIGILVALLLPAVQAAREAARRTQSMNNLKQLILAVLVYQDAKRAFPAQAICGEDGKPLLSWRVAILPYLGQQELYDKFKLDEPWDSPNNLPLVNEMPAVFVEPSSPNHAPEDGKTHYLCPTGPNVFLTGNKEGREINTISDGAANSIAILQVGDDQAVEWTKPADLDVTNGFPGIRSVHPNVYLAAWADGRITAIPQDTPAEQIVPMLTVDGGEPVVEP
jgi:type II secretory pathway pseudopilin PulG